MHACWGNVGMGFALLLRGSLFCTGLISCHSIIMEHTKSTLCYIQSWPVCVVQNCK